jgi:hypothetical protein
MGESNPLGLLSFSPYSLVADEHGATGGHPRPATRSPPLSVLKRAKEGEDGLLAKGPLLFPFPLSLFLNKPLG